MGRNMQDLVVPIRSPDIISHQAAQVLTIIQQIYYEQQFYSRRTLTLTVERLVKSSRSREGTPAIDTEWGPLTRPLTRQQTRLLARALEQRPRCPRPHPHPPIHHAG